MPDDRRAHAMSLPSDPMRLREARRWIARLATEAGLAPPHGHDLAVAFAEICANVHRHAYRGRRDGRVELQVAIEGDRIVVTVDHEGERFNPKSYTPPDLERPAESGYGMYLIARLVDDVSFEDTQRGGRVVLVKRRHPAGART
jgi:anti-sigma regulatory factor (Ser/Thr protein kinase)